MMMGWDRWDLKLIESVRGNDSRLSRTIRAFLRRSQPWTKHDLRLAIEKKPKTPLPKTRPPSHRSASENTHQLEFQT
jgi:hypothetical protein